jgi:hypothetical protein
VMQPPAGDDPEPIFASFKEIFDSLEATEFDLTSLRSSLDAERRQKLEAVPFRFLEWTITRVQHLKRIVRAPDGQPPPIETASLLTRLLVEALWILRWIGANEKRAREFALAGFRDMADIGQICIVQTKNKVPELAGEAIESQRGIAEAAARHGASLDKIPKWPVGSDLIERKLKHDGVAGFEIEDRRDWDTVYALSVYLHPAPIFVMAADLVSGVGAKSMADCGARIAKDIASHLRDLFDAL